MMYYVFGACFLISMGVLVYMIGKKYNNVDITFWSIAIVIPIVLLGYALKARTDSVDGAKIAFCFLYLDSTILLILMLFAMLKSLNVKVKSWIYGLGYGIGFIHYLTIITCIDKGLYYASMTIEKTPMGTITKMTDGPLKMTHYVYLTVMLILMLAVPIVCIIKKKDCSKKSFYSYMGFSIAGVTLYVIEMVTGVDFSLLPYLYVIGVITIARQYDNIHSHDMDSVVIDQKKEMSPRGYVAFDLKRQLLCYNDRAVEFVPEVKEKRIDAVFETKEQRLYEVFYNLIDKYEETGSGQGDFESGGVTFRCYVTSFSMHTAGKPMGYLCELSDVTTEIENKKQLEAALMETKQANKAKSSFLANMSHEIRTPINAVLGMDAMILRESNQDNILEYARNIKSAGDTLLSLINDILDFSKIESGKMEIIEGDYRLDSAINDIINMVKGKIEDKGLEFNINIMPNLPIQLRGDEVRIKQAILNILSNAVKYTRIGSIELSIGYKELDVEAIELNVTVKDTGIGIKKEDMERLFSPYQRLDEDINRNIEGTGLGLSITGNLLSMMGSELKVDSEYGEGSTFSFTIKQSMWGEDRLVNGQFDLSQTSSYKDEAREKFHGKNAKILVVDDTEMNLIVTKALLKRVQITPECCLSGQEAIELTEKNKYDIIFLDDMMPNLSGGETLVKIRELCPVNKDTPIVVLTANAVVGAKEQYLEKGFSDYLSKPVEGAELEDMIEKYLPEEKMERSFSVSPLDVPGLGAEDGPAQETSIVEKIAKINGIDVNEGINTSGDEKTYINVCANYYETAASRMDMIRKYFDEKDFDNFTIQTHALKSSSRLIGALKLSELALKMELAGNSKNYEDIAVHTDELLSMYEAIRAGLKEVFDEEKENPKDNLKKELSPKKFKRMLMELKELIEVFDFETAKLSFDSLSEYRLPDDFRETYNRLKVSMAEVNSDEIILALNGYLEG